MRRSFFAAFAVGVLTLSASAQQQPPAQQPPPFKSRVTVVPVDVRVLDRSGKPITDLTAADFSVTEEGAPQKIVHFSFHTLEPQPNAAAKATELEFRKPLGETVSPPRKRIFLIVLGRGREFGQVGPVRGVEAAMTFVKERLLPQDHAAVLAYNRATDFTTDHARLVETLKRYWSRHNWIEARLAQRFSGLAAVHMDPNDLGATIQSEIDAIFKAPGAVRSRSTDAETNADDDAQRTADQRRQRDIMLRAAAVEARKAAGVGAGLDYRVLDEMELIDAANFDEYVEKSFDTNVDLGNLYAGIRYLRLLDGEKHLVFISSRGLFLPRLESANSLAAFANDARVTIDVIHTSGTAGASSVPRGAINRVYTYGSVGSYAQLFQNANSAQIAELTGGQMTSVSSGEAFFRGLDVATRAQYLLGYVPSNSNWDGKYRRINVRVNRPGAQVLYRHGYVARNETTPIDGQQYLMYTRIASALNHSRELRDVGIELGEPSVQGTADKRTLSVTLRILPGAVTLKQVEGHYVGKLEAMSICADRNRQVVGELWHTINVKITEEEYQRFLREGTSATMQMQVSGEPRYLKTVLYDYTGDRLGSIMREIAKK